MLTLISCVFCLVANTLPFTTSSAERSATDAYQAKRVAVVSLATLEWPPYSSSSLPDGGEVVKQVTAIFRRMGYIAKVDVLPWSRAVRSTAGTQPLYLAYFPEYPLTDNHFKLSDSLGVSVVGLVQRADRQLQLDDARSLQNYRLGVVQDYVNTKEIDDLIAQNIIKPIVAIDDRQNIVRVLNGDIDAAVIDEKVLHYIMSNDAEIRQRNDGTLIFNDRLAQSISLHLAFSRYHQDSKLLEKFNQALAELKQENND